MRFKKIVEAKEKEIKSQKDILDDTINVENKSAEDKVKEDRKKNADNFKKVINELPIVEGYSYTENNGNYTVNIPNRASLAVLVEKLKNEAIKHRITRSTVEGYRYNVTFKYEKKDLKEANLANSTLKKGDKVRLDKEHNSNIKDKSLLDDEYEIIGFWNNEKVVDDDKAPENVRDLSGVRIKNTRTGKQYSVNRYQLTSIDNESLKEDNNYGHTYKYVIINDNRDKVLDKSDTLYNLNDVIKNLEKDYKIALDDIRVNPNMVTIKFYQDDELINEFKNMKEFMSFYNLYDPDYKNESLKEDKGGLNKPLGRKLGKILLPPKSQPRPRYEYEVYWYDNEECNGDPIFKTFSSKKRAQEWYYAHCNDADKFCMDEPYGSRVDESLQLTEDPIQDRLDELKLISRQRQLTDDEVKELATLSSKKNENLTEGKVNANIYTVLGWLANHKQAYNDFKSYFKIFDKGNSKMPTLDDIKGWISDHKELTQDYENFFDDKLTESCNKGRKLTEGEFGEDLVLSKIETNHLLKDGAVDIARYVGDIEIHIEERPYEEGKYDIYIMNPYDEVKLSTNESLREKAPRELSNKEIDRKVNQRQRYLNHINKEKKVSEPLFTYQFPELTNTDIRKLKDYNLKLEARFVDSDDFSTEGDCVVSGTENNIKKYADEYLGYELIDDYLVNYNDFDFEDLIAQGKLELEEKKVDNKKQPKARIVGDGEEEMKFFNDTASGDLGKAMCEDKDDDIDDDYGDLEEPFVDDDNEITLNDISDDDDTNALDVLKDKIDIHGELSDDGESEILTIAEKGKLDDKKAPKITIEANEEETEVLAKEFCDDNESQKVEIEGDDEYDFSDIRNIEYVDSAKEQEKKEVELEEKIKSQQVIANNTTKQENMLEKMKKANNLDDEIVTVEDDVDSIKGLESLM